MKRQVNYSKTRPGRNATGFFPASTAWVVLLLGLPACDGGNAASAIVHAPKYAPKDRYDGHAMESQRAKAAGASPEYFRWCERASVVGEEGVGAVPREQGAD